MSYTKDRPLCPEEKNLLISVKHYFDRNKSEFGSSESSAQMTADALGIGLATVNRVMSSYHKDPDSINAPAQLRGRPTYSVDMSHQEAVRTYIRQANLEGCHITLESIRNMLKEKSPNESFHLSTLSKTLDRWGFELGRLNRPICLDHFLDLPNSAQNPVPMGNRRDFPGSKNRATNSAQKWRF